MMKTNIWSFATAKLQAKRRSFLAIIPIAMITVLAGCASMTLVSLEGDTVSGPERVRQGYDINPRDISLWGLYKDDSRKQVSINSGNIVFNKHAAGPQTVRVRVSGQEVSFQTEVMALRTLTIASQPRTVIFKQGQDANPAWPGLEIRGEWDQMGGDRIDLASCEVIGFNKNTVGRQTVRVTFEGQSATFNVEVRGLASIRIVELPAKLAYDQGSTLDLTGLKVVGVWEGLPEEDIAIIRNDITGFDASKVGNQLLTINKNGRTATFNVSVVQSLNGTWVNVTSGIEAIVTFNNGNWTYAINNPNIQNPMNNVPYLQGTYTTSGGKMTRITTHYNSAAGAANMYGIPSRMYTQDELEAAIRASEKGKTMSEAEIRSAVGRGDGLQLMYTTTTQDYSLSGNTLTLGTLTYTKR